MEPAQIALVPFKALHSMTLFAVDTLYAIVDSFPAVPRIIPDQRRRTSDRRKLNFSISEFDRVV